MDNCLHAVDSKLKSLEESTQALKLHRNTLVPISRLPTEILSTIFSLLLLPSSPITPFPISHVCHRWRKILLNFPYLWSHIDFTKLTLAGTAEMLARAKMAPLRLKVEGDWSMAKFGNLQRQIGAHIHHTRHLRIAARQRHLEWTFVELASSSAPFLELLSIANRNPEPVFSDIKDDVDIPDNLFNGVAPKLVYLRLDNCGIGWMSPLLKGLRDLRLFSFPVQARTTLNTWLDTLKQMRLERLTLHDAIPIHSVGPEPVEPGLTVELSFLTELNISASAWDCIVVLAHLVLPALSRLRVNVQIQKFAGRKLGQLIPYVARNAHGPRDTEPLRSLFIGGNKNRAEIVAWTMPRKDTEEALGSSVDLLNWIRLARVAFRIMNLNRVYPRGATGILPTYGALLTRLPLTSIASLTVKGLSPLTGQVWRIHAPKWHKLKRPGGDLFPSLEELVLVNVSLDAQKVYYLCNMLIKLVELKIPLRKLDLRTCVVANRAVQLLSKIVADVQGPLKRESGDVEGKSRGGIEALDEEVGADEGDDEFDDAPPSLGSWGVDDDDDFDIDDDSNSSDRNIEA